MRKDISPKEARLFVLMGFILGLEIIGFLVYTGVVEAGEQGKLCNVSAYCVCEKCCGSWSDGVTASGHVIQPGDHFIAAPKRYPFGTKMIIPGYNNGRPVEVKDRGGAIKGNKIDLFFGDKDGVSGHQRALNWGRQHIYVEILP